MRRTAMSLFVGLAAIAGMALAHPASATPWLGVYSQDISPELREGMNYNGAGALVSRVVPDSPADQAGVERGDVIVRVGGQDVGSPGDLVEAVGSASEDASIDILVVRDGTKKSLRAKLAARPEGGDGDDETPAPRMPGMNRMKEMKGMRGMKGMKGMSGMRHFEIQTPDAPGAPGAPRVFIDHDGDGDDDNDMLGRLPEMLGNGMMGRARLGVRIESLNPDLATYFGSRDAKGALVLDVVEGSPAQKAGIRAGDVIQRVDGKTVDSAGDLTEAVRSSDKSVSISLLRHGAKQTVNAELGDAPQAMRFRSGPGGMNWKSNDNNKTFEWQSPDGQRRVKRIVIQGDDDDQGDMHGDMHSGPEGSGREKRIIIRRGGNGGMERRGMSADRESTEQLREEMQQLKEQLDQLREELKSNHR